MGVAVFYVGIVLLALPITVIGGNFTVFYHEWVDDAKLEDDIRATLLADAHALDSPALGAAGALDARAPPLGSGGNNEGLAAALQLPQSPDRMKITFRHEEEGAVEDRAFVTSRRKNNGSIDPQNSSSSRALGALGAIVAAASGGEKSAVV